MLQRVGYVQFEKAEDARAAVELTNGMAWDGHRLQVEFCASPVPTASHAASYGGARSAQRPQISSSSRSEPAREDRRGDSDTLCCVCLDAGNDTVLCHAGGVGHKCVCHECASVLQKEGQDCPLCRAPITAVCKVWDH